MLALQHRSHSGAGLQGAGGGHVSRLSFTATAVLGIAVLGLGGAMDGASREIWGNGDIVLAAPVLPGISLAARQWVQAVACTGFLINFLLSLSSFCWDCV